MTRPSARPVIGSFVLLAAIGLAGCTSADAKPAAPTGRALAVAKTGEACRYLAAAEANPVGSKDQAVGAAMLAHAVTLSIRAKEADAAWAPFNKDMTAIGSKNGLPALKRVTAVCAQWSKDQDYFTTHAPNG